MFRPMRRASRAIPEEAAKHLLQQSRRGVLAVNGDNGYPFEIRRPEYATEVKFGGYVRVEYDQEKQRNYFVHEGYQSVMAIPYDMPIVGYDNHMVNTLMIWDAEPKEGF